MTGYIPISTARRALSKHFDLYAGSYAQAAYDDPDDVRLARARDGYGELVRIVDQLPDHDGRLQRLAMIRLDYDDNIHAGNHTGLAS